MEIAFPVMTSKVGFSPCGKSEPGHFAGRQQGLDKRACDALANRRLQTKKPRLLPGFFDTIINSYYQKPYLIEAEPAYTKSESKE